jgi:transcriptional regulator of acetoin/glycerol metabolism
MGTGEPSTRGLIRESWARSASSSLVPDRVDVLLPLVDGELEHVRRTHPLADALPMIESLLVTEVADDTGLVVVVGDAQGRLLWVDGDRRAMGVAEEARAVPGSDWSESRAGTNAPGTALTLDRTVQVRGEEHFSVQVQALSCTAVPIHDLRTLQTLGVLDITGGPDAVGPHALPLIEATVAAIERELALRRIVGGEPDPVLRTAAPRLTALGRTRAVLTANGRTVPLSLRHAELLTLLAWHRDGLTAERLAELVHGSPAAVATIRPEMTRLRRLLEASAPSLVPRTRPYRLPIPLELDARRLVALLDRGAHRAALDLYAGDLLPSSVAPGIEEIREEIAAHLREALLSGAQVDLLLAYSERVVPADPEPLLTALQILPPHSARRASVVARLEALG